MFSTLSNNIEKPSHNLQPTRMVPDHGHSVPSFLGLFCPLQAQEADKLLQDQES